MSDDSNAHTVTSPIVWALRIVWLVILMVMQSGGTTATAQDCLSLGPALPIDSNASRDVGNDFTPIVATDSAGLWLAAWVSRSDLGGIGSDADILFARSTDDGVSWTMPLPLNSTAASDTGADVDVQLAAANGVWLAVWGSTESSAGNVGTDSDIFFSRSLDQGATWSEALPVVLNHAQTDHGEDRGPRLASDGSGHWIVVWTSDDDLDGSIGMDQDVLYSVSPDDGMSWSEPLPLNSTPFFDVGQDTDPDIATDSLGVWIAVWTSTQDLGGRIGVDADILAASSTNAGTDWSTATVVNDGAFTDSRGDLEPRIETDGQSTWIAVWESLDDLNGTIGTDRDILYAFSLDDGSDWSATAAVADYAATDDGSDRSPVIRTDGLGDWIVAWSSTVDVDGAIGDDFDILFARSMNGGANWAPAGVFNGNAISDGGFADRAPDMAADGLQRWIVIWESNDDFLGTIENDFDIIVTPAEDLADCNDMMFCNGIETCTVSGQCQQGDPPCAPRICDDRIDACFECDEDDDCDDGLICNGFELCAFGSCEDGRRLECPVGEVCLEPDGECGPGGGCRTDDDCDDGLFCNGAELCDRGVCREGPRPCESLECDEERQICIPGCRDPCDDGDPCTNLDECVADLCVGTPVDCSKLGGECHVVSCDPQGPPGNCDISTFSPACADCNLNERLDGDDIALGCSEDELSFDLVPDECIDALQNGNWSAAIWDVVGQPNPSFPTNIFGPLDDRSVTIDGLEVSLDLSVEVATVRLLNNATLSVVQSEAADLAVVGAFGSTCASNGNFSSEGSIIVGSDRVIDVRGNFSLGANGVYMADPEAVDPVSAGLIVDGSIQIMEAAPGGAMYLQDLMTVHVLDIILAAGVGEGDCTPPILDVAGGASLDIEGDIELAVSPVLHNTSGVVTSLAGSFFNASTQPESFLWTSTLQLDGGGVEQFFEVAGTDFGPLCSGLEGNFAIATLDIAAAADVIFGDERDNDDAGQEPCSEALYVNDLLLREGSRITLDDCRIYYERLVVEPGAEIVILGRCAALSCMSSCTAVEIVGSDPPDGAVDARQPYELDGSRPAGWDEVDLFLEQPGCLNVGDIELHLSDGGTLAIDRVESNGKHVTVVLESAIPAGACATMTHPDSGWQTSFGFLPADVNGDRMNSPLDILALIDGLNEITALDIWQCDIDRSGGCAPLDILRLIDLLNGAGEFEPWNGSSLPECP